MIFRITDKKSLLFLLPSVVVPIAYVAVMVHEEQYLSLRTLLVYIFWDYGNGNASVSFNAKGILLGGINLFRTFLQVHGYIAFLIKHSWIWIIPLVMSAVAFSISTHLLVRNKIGFQNFNSYQRIHLVALILQVSFAFLSDGNAEFMAMVPFLVAIVVSNLPISKTALSSTVMGLVIWNISFGMLPAKIYPDATDMVVNQISRSANHKSAYILTEAPKISNRLDYLGIPSPLILRYEKMPLGNIKPTIDSLTGKGFTVYTDCINRPNPISRASLLGHSRSINENYFPDYQLLPIDSVVALGGRYYLYRIVP